MSHLQTGIEDSIDLEKLRLFWTFVYERQEIYVKRFINKEPSPWTSDPIFRSVFFTNVYRELDKGTIFLKEHIIDRGSVHDEMIEILAYRLFNNRFTYKIILNNKSFGCWEHWNETAGILLDYSAIGGYPLFSMAHMTTSMRQGGQPTKCQAACWVLHQHWKNIKAITANLLCATGLKDLCSKIAELDGFGSFLAYEVATDMGYSKRLGRFSEDDWASPGPGCRKGIEAIIPIKNINYLDVMVYLKQNQREFFNSLNLDFKFLDGKDLSLRNVEHSLCEFYKYNMARATGKTRRKYYGT